MNKKKLLMCYHSSEFGGVEKQILDIIEGLSDRIDFTVVCPRGPLVNDYLKAGAVKHIDLSPKFEADILYSFKIARLIRAENFDIVHSHELLAGSLATFGAWLARCPQRIYHVHTPFSQWKHGSLKKYPALIINTIVNFVVGNFFATSVIALTPFIKRIRVGREFIFPWKVKVIPNGVKLKDFIHSSVSREKFRKMWKIGKAGFVVGNISRFTAEKGHYDLISAFADVVQQMPDKKVKLVLAGGGILLDNMKKLVKNLNIEDNVVFTGEFDEKNKRGMLSAFDLFVFPSHAEGFGIVLVEAMAMGLPILASDLAVFKDVGGNAIKYFRAADISGLSNELKELLLNSSKLEEFAEKSHKQSKNYSIERFWENYGKLYTNSY